MTKAHLLTIGTEITTGEVVNSNAAWIGTQLEKMGVRVHSHLSVRDQREEIVKALRWVEGDVVVVTGGLGPTTDDITRECMAEFFAQPLEFDDVVWKELETLYLKRQLPLREAHKHQCFFPKNSERLANLSGTALGFYYKLKDTHFFVLPGPPRELESMWKTEAVPRLKKIVQPPNLSWHYWTFFAVPESEVAELVEKIIAGAGLEVGYRAQVPYVRVKLAANLKTHAGILREMDHLLGPSQIKGNKDLAEEFLRLWPAPQVQISDNISEGALAPKLFHARHQLLQNNVKVPKISYSTFAENADFKLAMDGEGFTVTVKAASTDFHERRTLPYKIILDSERGRRYATETALWLAVNALNS